MFYYFTGVYIFLFDPPSGGEGQKCGQIKCFSPIDLKCTKLKKRLTNFRLRRAAHHYNKFNLGQKYKSRRGGGNMNLLYTPAFSGNGRGSAAALREKLLC